jgi:hypothetical protein
MTGTEPLEEWVAKTGRQAENAPITPPSGIPYLRYRRVPDRRLGRTFWRRFVSDPDSVK